MPPGIGYGLMPAWASGSLLDERKKRAPQPPFISYLRGDQGVQPYAPPNLGYVPSAQRFERLAPSEQQGYAGYLEDELGLHAPDVFALMDKLRPRGAMSSIPRWIA
ncbi:MAG: hypothetical protein ACRDM7_05355 [Thermoleophilaceae bacterium]